MAEKNTPNFHNRNSDVKDLLAMLDRMKNRPRVKEVEDALIEQGRPDLVRMDLFDTPTTQDGFVPTVSNEKLADLLITPEERMELPTQPTEKKETEDEKDQVSLFYGEDQEEEEWEDLPAPPEKKQNPIAALLCGAVKMLPRKGDSPVRTLAKGGFWLGLLAAILVAVLLVNEMKIAPLQHQMLHQELIELYQDSTDATVVSGAYPSGMLASFKQLYDRNPQVKGWLSLHAEGKDFLNIEYPFVQGKSNAYYQNHDYDGNPSDYGTLYVDADARIAGYNDADRVLILHSNATPDQSMLSSINRLVGPVDYARAVPELTLTTLYRRDIYYVFAMAMFDGTGKDPFQPLQTSFAGEDAFLQYIRSLGARSLFDYPVDVTYDDSIVLLTVPTGEVSTGLTDGYLVVAARRRRPGEISVQSNQIMKNKDAIMPYSWYTSRGKTLHSFFYSGEEPVDEVSTTGTIPTTTLVDPHGTTSTTHETGGGIIGGIQVDKNSTGLIDPSTTGTGTEQTGSTTSTSGQTGSTIPTVPTQSTGTGSTTLPQTPETSATDPTSTTGDETSVNSTTESEPTYLDNGSTTE